jgi:IclR family pca regulon transcriptional regulator
VLEGCDIVYVARVPTKRIMSVALNIGARLPAVATSMGRVLLAELDEAAIERFLGDCPIRRYTKLTVTEPRALRDLLRRVRQQGYCMVDQELEEGLISIAVPLRNKRGQVLAAMNVSGHASRTTPARVLKEHLPLLQAAARRIAQNLP